MAALSDAQANADADLRRAVEAYARVFGLIDEDALILDYIAVGVAQQLADDGRTRMFTCYPGGTSALYKVVGLLHCSLHSHEALIHGEGDR